MILSPCWSGLTLTLRLLLCVAVLLPIPTQAFLSISRRLGAAPPRRQNRVRASIMPVGGGEERFAYCSSFERRHPCLRGRWVG